MTQEMVAKKLGISQSAFAKLERGELRIDVGQLEEICVVFGLSLTEVMQEFEGKHGRLVDNRTR